MTYLAPICRAQAEPVLQLNHAAAAAAAQMDADAMLASALPRPAFDDRQELFTPSAAGLLIIGAAAGILAALAASYLPELTDHILSIQAQGARI